MSLLQDWNIDRRDRYPINMLPNEIQNRPAVHGRPLENEVTDDAEYKASAHRIGRTGAALEISDHNYQLRNRSGVGGAILGGCDYGNRHIRFGRFSSLGMPLPLG